MPTSRIEGLYNFRDTGGMPLQSGGTTRPGVLYRSDALSNLTTSGLDALAKTDIGVIVDFRTAEERKAAPDRLPETRPFRAVDLTFLEGAMADMAKQFMHSGAQPSQDAMAQAVSSIPALGDLYVGMLEHGASEFAQVARLIAESNDAAPSAVLVHCTAGKDRTGVATALMLDAAGAERSAIVADYAQSQENLSGAWAEGMIHMITSLGVPLTDPLRTLVTGTPPAAIEQALGWVDDNAESSARYLQSGGLTDDELAGLRARLSA